MARARLTTTTRWRRWASATLAGAFLLPGLIVADAALAAPKDTGPAPDGDRPAVKAPEDDSRVARRRRRRRAKKRPAPRKRAEPAPAPPTDPEPAEASSSAEAAAGEVIQRRRTGPSRIEFDDRLIQGQTNKANAIYLFERRASELRTLVKKRRHYHREIDEMLE